MKVSVSPFFSLIPWAVLGLTCSGLLHASTRVVEFTADPGIRVDVILDTRPEDDCRRASLPGARCLAAEEFLGPHRRLGNLSGLLWLLGTAGLTGSEHVLVAGARAGDNEFLAGLLFIAGQQRISVLTLPLAAAGAQLALRPGRPRSRVREDVYQAPMRDDRVLLRHELQSSLDASAYLLLDGRSEAEYLGALVRSARGGHLPGALHLPARSLLPIAAESLWQVGPDAVAYGHDAYEGLGFLARLIANGLETRLYLGGWSDWSSDGALPVDLLTLPDVSAWQSQVHVERQAPEWVPPGPAWLAMMIFMLAVVAVAGYLAGRRRTG